MAPCTTEVNYATVHATSVQRVDYGRLVLLCLAAWAVPGAGHLWQGRRAKGLVFLIALPLMFWIGVSIQGRLFPFDLSELLVGLMAMAEVAIGIPYLVAASLGYGVGDVRAATYEYGNAFLVTVGLLNLLVIADAYDIALGRK